ncbi:hypothetical protein AGMMS50256_27900 [Betaproteobacteria bacterium]|nr:hypothetical protein AGMMS50256_27900 [Betaproteobacteria bacterium]
MLGFVSLTPTYASFRQTGRIVFDGQQIVAASFHDLLRDLRLTAQGIDCDDTSTVCS